MTTTPTTTTTESTERDIAMTHPAETAPTTTPEPIDPTTPAGALALALAANVPVLLIGAPGTAKTATIEALAAARGAYLEVVIASAQDPTTILGIPMPSADRKYTEPTMPGWARRINDAAAAGRETVLFLDELTTVPPSVQAPLLGVVQSRRAEGWTLPEDCRIIAAANPPDLAVGGWALDAAMANRWAHIEWPAPAVAWIGWARSQSSPALQLIADYIEAVPSELLAVPTDIRKRSAAWPSPRSWTRAAQLIDASGGDCRAAAMMVGAAAAGTFAAWAATRDVPTVRELLDGSRPLPTRADAFTSACGALAQAVTADTLGRTLDVLATGIAIDPAVVAQAARTIAEAGHLAGIAPLVSALADAGIALRPTTPAAY